MLCMTKKLAHSDLKTANVLLEEDHAGHARCVLTDFGITQILSKSLVVEGFEIANIRGLSIHYLLPRNFLRYGERK
jgi:serine/threonine protein kinase